MSVLERGTNGRERQREMRERKWQGDVMRVSERKRERETQREREREMWKDIGKERTEERRVGKEGRARWAPYY